MGQQLGMDSAETISSLLHVMSTVLTHMSVILAGTTGMAKTTEVSGPLSTWSLSLQETEFQEDYQKTFKVL